MAFNMDDYVDVSTRIRLFREKHPDGSLQSEITLAEDGSWVLAKAWAYRDRVDTRPGIGHSRLAIPGKTTYTKDSEVENSETSAWGRAIVAALAADTKKIASTEEVARHGSGGEPSAVSQSNAPNAEPSRKPTGLASSPVPSPAPGGAAISPASSTVPENTPAAAVTAQEEVEPVQAPSSKPGSQFTPPEKAQAKIKQRETEKEGAKAPATDAQVAELKGIVKTGVVTYPQVEEMLAAYGVSKFAELQVGEAQELLGKLERLSRNAGKAA